MALTHAQRAQLRDRGAEYAAMHTLFIGGEEWTSKLMSANVVFTTDGGGSNLDITVEGSLEDYVDAPVRFSLGYGRDDIRTYFRGRLMMPTDHESLPQASGVAFGPFRLMVDGSLGNTETYQGRNLEYVFMDLSRRAEYPPGDFLVIGGRKFNVPAGEIFNMDTSLADVANSLMEKAKYVAFDQPGGRRVVMPEPKPGSNGPIKYTYNPDQYKSLTVTPRNDVSYYKVAVYRNEGESFGRPPIYAERVIDAPVRFRPQKSRIMWVGDFPGTQFEAGNEAARLALALRDGEKNFTMTLPFNRDIGLYDGFRVRRVKNLGGGIRQTQTYVCTVKSLTVNYTPGSMEMTLEGTCYEVKDERTEIDERFLNPATSYGVIVPSIEVISPDDTFVIPEDYTFVG